MPENVPTEAEHGYFRAVVDHVKAPFAVGAFLGLLAQLLDVSGWAALALVLLGGAGAVVAQWRWRASRWQALAGGGLATACLLSILVLASTDSRSQSDQGDGPRAGDTGSQVGPPDSEFYMTYDGRHPSREQECMGLLGLCFGQPVSYAIHNFGSVEKRGYPQAGDKSLTGDPSTCHVWEPPKISAIRVCEANGAITVISVSSFADTQLALSAPDDLTIHFPLPVGHNAEDITEALRTKPFASQYLGAESAAMYSYSWYFPPETEGSPTSKITIHGEESDFPEEEPVPCSEELLRYRYADLLPLSQEAPIVSVEVSWVLPDDLKQPTAC